MASTNSSVWYLDHLLKWLEMFDLKVTRSHTGDLSDGVAIALVLNKIDPSWFNEAWISKIKQNVGSNKILKVSNLKKVVERVVDFYCIHDEERPTGPDVNRIGENDDEGELCRLLQLVLGCAVRCERKQEFIQAILSMEEDVQQGLMAAIEELPVASGLNSNTDSIDISPQNQAVLQTDLQTILRQLESANEAKEQLSRQCQQLNLQISLLQDERHHLQAEVELLRKEGLVESSLDREGTNNDTIRELKRQVLLLREELDRTETAKEEFRMRVETLEMDLGKLRIRQEELQNAAEQTRSLKDEVDILRERSARLATAESTIDSMRKKIEEVNDLKRQLRKVEEKNAQYIQQNMELEEELKKLGPWKSQLEVQKKQNADIQAKLDEERKKADKFEFQNKNLQSKLEALTQEKERLVVERDKLKDINEELKYAQLNPGNVLGEQASSTTGVDTLDMIPHEIKEKLLRLEHENRLLRQQQDERQRGGPVDKAEVLQTVIDGHQERINRLEAENRCACLSNDPHKSCPKCNPLPSFVSDLKPANKVGFLSKPVFAGSVSTSPTRASSGKVSTDRVQSIVEKFNLAHTQASGTNAVKVGSVERLKQEFLAHSYSNPKPFQRSSSYGYDKALGFCTDNKQILDMPFKNPSAECDELQTDVSVPKEEADRIGPNRQVSVVMRKRSSTDFQELVKRIESVQQNRCSLYGSSLVDEPEKPPPPPVDAIVITRENLTNSPGKSENGVDQVDSCYHSHCTRNSSMHIDKDQMDSLFLDFGHSSLLNNFTSQGNQHYSSSLTSSSAVKSMPDDAIEIDVSFRGRGSVDSELISISSLSIASELMTPLDQSFERSDSVLLTPRSITGESDSVSRKSFGKLKKKKKMFKAAANAMFSLCGP